MNDTSGLVPSIAAALGIAPATLLLIIMLLNQAAKVAGRLIPNDATGILGVIGKICVIIGTDPSSRITNGVSVQDVATKVITPPVTKSVAAKIADDKGVPVSEVTPNTGD